MTTDRRSFLRSLALLAAAPLVLSRALAVSKPLVIHSTLDPLTEVNLWCDKAEAELERETKGHAIKVPSNQCRGYHSMTTWKIGLPPDYHFYDGDWNGTFKLEEGCTNPAWVWFDMCERAYAGRPKRLAAEIAQNITEDTKKEQLDLRALYDWGVWCDELTYGISNADFERRRQSGQGFPATEMADYMSWIPRYSLVGVTTFDDSLRENLRMSFLHWQTTDRRYQYNHEPC